MPQAPQELRDEWADDSAAWGALRGNYTDDRGVIRPKAAHAITDREWSAIHPSKRTPTTIAKVWALLLRSRPGVLLTHCIDRCRMKAKFLAATSSEIVQVKAGQPRTSKAQSVLLSVVAIVPDEIDLSGLLVQQSIQ